MKKAFSSSITWTILLLSILTAVLYFCGFRIVRFPVAENNWNTIAINADWAGVIASLVAIIVAIQIPKKIANQQNKIALFEKRYSVYYVISNCVFYAHMLEKYNKSGSDWNLWFAISFDAPSPGQGISWEEQGRLYNEVSRILAQSELLFGEKIAKKVESIETKLLILLQAERHHDNIIQRQKEYIEDILLFEKEELNKIKKLLDLT